MPDHRLDTAELMLIEQRVTNDGPSAGVAYLLWFFTGLVAGHRHYLGRHGSAVAQMLLFLVGVGFFWWIVDAFMLPGMIREKQNELRRRYRRSLESRFSPAA